MNILLCAEGVTDSGRRRYCEKTGQHIQEDGALQKIIRKFPESENASFTVKTRGDIKKFSLFRERKDLGGRASYKLAAIAAKEKCTHIAYHQDEDNKGFDVIYEQVEEYFADARAHDIKCIAIVPMHMTESWLLSDRNAFEYPPKDPPLPKNPEEVWGKPESDNHPKKYLERVLAQFHKEPSAELYSEIADKLSVDVLKQKCPISFGRFFEDMKELCRTTSMRNHPREDNT